MGNRKSSTKSTRLRLYAASRFLDFAVERELGLQIPCDVYMQDPWVAATDPKFGFAKDFFVRWEPGIADGPTSARFAIVDYNGDTGSVAPMAKWDSATDRFLDANGQALDKSNIDSLQFHQVHVWAILQRALDFFQGGPGLGRDIPYGFEGNRLIVVPHAGYGQNAFYDRTSKSLQFYYFEHEQQTVYTCLSTDIVNHEFGHAMLDGIRPYLMESVLPQTGGFHEFVADFTAILSIMRNNDFRQRLADATAGNLSAESHLSRIAQEFGKAVSDKPFLRSARNRLKMSSLKETDGPHRVSEVLTGTMFDILIAFAEFYITQRQQTAIQAFWNAIQRMQRTVLQPLDLLPPVDVTFRDYALAVLRWEQISNPTDPNGYLPMMLEIFIKRGILKSRDRTDFLATQYVFKRPKWDVFHSVESIFSSSAAAYRFLNDNREQMFIPAHQDVTVVDLYDAHKMTREGSRLPRQIVLEYLWREDVVLAGREFAELEGSTAELLCGGTLVFDETGNVLEWARKPGTEGRGRGDQWKQELKLGQRRRQEFLQTVARLIQAGGIGAAIGSGLGLLGSRIPPIGLRQEDGKLRFQMSPHMSLSGDDQELFQGGKKWEISS